MARLDLEIGFMADALLVDSDVDRRGALAGILAAFAAWIGRGQRSKLSFRAWSKLILKRMSTSRPVGEWKDVLADGAVVGRIMHAAAAPPRMPWL